MARRRKPRRKYIRPKYVRVGKATFVPRQGFKLIDSITDKPKNTVADQLVRLHNLYQELPA